MHLHSHKVDIEKIHRRAATGRIDSEASPAALVSQRKAGPNDLVGLQQSLGNAAVVQMLQDDEAGDAQAAGRSPVLDVVGQGRGEPLAGQLRAGMEQALDTDLSDVRVHTGGAAAESARSVQAHAYTVGNEIVFGAGQYDPGSAAGQHTLAHELTHVVQQRNGPVAGTPTGDGIAVSDPSDSYERAAESNADKVMAGEGASPHAGDGGGGHSVQREAGAEEEEPVQGVWVQRTGKSPDEEEEPVQGLWLQRAEEAGEEEEPVQGLWLQREGAPEEQEEPAKA
ncbi:MAG TPA: DUF4157 domain-containing protein [Acidimicrobiales bacterium]|nr:DUF4157 domain-containing protein [Acidimicrobiales bacterium]